MCTVAAVALGNTAFHGQTGLLQALKVFLCRGWPPLLGGITLGFGVKVETDLILLIKLSLEIDQGKGDGYLFLLDPQVILCPLS